MGNIGAASFADDSKYWQTISSQLDPIPLQDTLRVVVADYLKDKMYNYA